MGLLIIIPFGAVAAWSIYRIFGWLYRGDYGMEWWRAFKIMFLAGVVLGIFFAGFIEYNLKAAKIRISGFPIPITITNLDDGQVIKQPLPLLLRLPARATDFLFGITLCLAPIALAAFIRENKGTKEFSFTPRPPDKSP